MTRITSFLILFLIINNTTILGQPTQIGIVDFYGTITNEAELRKCLPFIENESVQFLTDSAYPKAKKAIVDCLLRQPKVKQADITFVCCDDQQGKWIVFIGIDTKSKVVSHSAKTDDIKLSEEINSIYDSLMNLIMVAIEKGEATEDDSSGHSLMTYLPARLGKLPQKEYGLKIDKKFINLNCKNEKESIQSHTDCQHPKGV